jgi:DNA-binding transcriptional MerR regulator
VAESTGQPDGRRRDPSAAGYRIDDLAREAGTTVRNVRAYQDRGLLPPPRRSGRVGWYSEAHLARLRLIGSLLERGYTLANIAELLSAWQGGRDVGAVLGLEAALAGPWGERSERIVTRAGLADLFGHGSEAFVETAIEIGLLVPTGDGRLRVENPAAIDVGRLLVGAGVPLPAVLDAARLLRSDVTVVAQRLVGLVQDHVVGPLGRPVAARDVERLATLVGALRPLAAQVVEAELARALELEIRRRLGEHLGRLAGLDATHGPAQDFPATT